MNKRSKPSVPETPAIWEKGLWSWTCDPGAKRLAVSIFRMCEIQWIGWVEVFVSFPFAQTPPPVQFGIEKPRVYPGVPDVDANDLIDVWGAGCWFRSYLQHSNPRLVERIVYPHEWKRQVRKAVHHDRIWNHLTPRERALFPADTYDRIQRGCETGKYSSEVHNLLDSAGIGLFLEERTGRAGKTIHYG